MQDLEVTLLNDNHDLYKVCLEEDGVRACTLVSSMHLAEDKNPQLKAAIRRKSAAAFLDTIHARDISEE